MTTTIRCEGECQEVVSSVTSEYCPTCGWEMCPECFASESHAECDVAEAPVRW